LFDRVLYTIFVDRGYRDHCRAGATEVHLAGKQRISRSLKRWFKRRNTVEPIIGQLKSGHGLGQNYLMGVAGDQINAILAGCGFDFRKVLRAIFFVPDFIRSQIDQIRKVIRNFGSGYLCIKIRAA